MTQSVLATYSDWKPIKTRRVIQIIFEVPWEGADAAYQVLRMPDPGGSEWYSITKHVPNAGALSSPVGEAGRTQQGTAPASRLTQLAGMACNEPLFWKYLTKLGYRIDSEDRAVNRELSRLAIYEECKVKSRKEFIVGTPAGDRWLKLYDAFALWRDAPEAAE